MADSMKKKTTNLFSLNDKCLEKIFDYLKVDARAKMLEASEQRLDSTFRNTIIKGNFRVSSRMDNFEELVQNYGSYISEVDIIAGDQWINLLAEFCVEGRLCRLRVFVMPITDSGMITRSKAMLSGLKSLVIDACEINDDNLGRLLALCPQLENLSLCDMPNNTLKPLLKMTSKNMKSICLDGFTNNNRQRSTMIQFLTKYRSLRHFKYYLSGSWKMPYIDIVCKMLPNLDQLLLSSDNIGPLLMARKQLKNLQIQLRIYNFASVNKLLSMSRRLHTLAINLESQSYPQFDSLIDAICTCTTLQKLDLDLGGSNLSGYVVKLAESLPFLRSFDLLITDPGDRHSRHIIETNTRFCLILPRNCAVLLVAGSRMIGN